MKQHLLLLSSEFIKVNGNVYSSDAGLSQSYFHYGESLSYPIITEGHDELISCFRYQYKRLYVQAKFIVLNYKELNTVFTRKNIQGSVGFIINPSYNLVLFSDYQKFSDPRNFIRDFSVFSFGIRSCLYNLYTDN